MKLYKEASLMMLPTSVKDGKLYSIFPQPKVIGEELVTYSDFNYGSGGWSLVDGKWVFDDVAAGYINHTSISVTVGQIYKVVVDVSVPSGVANIRFTSGNGQTVLFNYTDFSDGVTTFYTTVTGVNGNIQRLYAPTTLSDAFTLNSISIREVDQLPADFTFSRGSNLAATRINEQGLIEKGRENLLLQSNQFDTTWLTLNLNTPANGYEGYDGSSDAWLLTDTATSGDHRLYIANSQSGVYTLSVYAKAGTKSILYIQSYISNTSIAYFDLSAGSVLSSTSDIDSNIEDIGNGWYRCFMTFNKTNSYVTIGMAESATTTYTGDGTGTIYIQDAQLEVGLVATDYIESGATTGKAGVLEDLPRLNWGGNCPSLLLEPSRQNLFNHSEYSPALSTIGSPTFNANATISPEGYQNMAEYSSSAISDRYQQNLGVLTGQHTYSAFFKYSGTAKSVYIRMSDTASRLKISIESSGVTIDLTGTTNVDDSGVIDYGNGIYRVYMVFTPSTGTTFGQFYPSATNTAGSVYAYGFQIEQGSYPTSYIPTHGTSVTRSGDGSLSMSNFSDVFGSSSLTEYSIFLDIKDARDGGDTQNFVNKGNNNQGRINLLGNYAITYYSTETGYVSSSLNIVDGNRHKYMLVAYNGTIKQYFDGALVSTSYNPNDEMVSVDMGGVRDIALSEYTIFPTALSDNECINLTTI